jgi:hypothetical protein
MNNLDNNTSYDVNKSEPIILRRKQKKNINISDSINVDTSDQIITNILEEITIKLMNEVMPYVSNIIESRQNIEMKK